MPTATTRSPKFRNSSFGPIAKGSTSEIEVAVDGLGCSWVRVTPSQAPDALSVHSFAVNVEGSAETDITGASAVALTLTAVNRSGPHLIRSLWITSGKDGTTFDVEALL